MHSECIYAWYLMFCGKPLHYPQSFDVEILTEGKPVDN